MVTVTATQLFNQTFRPTCSQIYWPSPNASKDMALHKLDF